MHVIGRPQGSQGATGRLGTYLARDGSAGATVGFDFERPHAALVVGKRGAGKSHTLGVLAEGGARAPGVAPVVVDPMGAFGGLAARSDPPAPTNVLDAPRVRADAVPPRAWPDLLGLSPTGAVGALVWRAATDADSLDGVVDRVADAGVEESVRRAARNHLDAAAAWGVFDPAGVDAASLLGGEATVLDVSEYESSAANAVVRAAVATLYRACVDGDAPRLPWVFVDEAHAFVDGVAEPAIRRVLTRGRAPGVSLVLATQRPSALPPVAVSQADLLVAHRLTSEADVEALAAARPTYLAGRLDERLPSGRGEALVVDDATESVHTIRVRARDTPHGGDSPRASDYADVDADGTETPE